MPEPIKPGNKTILTRPLTAPAAGKPEPTAVDRLNPGAIRPIRFPHTIQVAIWTALPNGYVTGNGKRLRLSISVSPKLWTDENLPRPTLSQFAAWLDWPKTLTSAAFTVEFTGGVKAKATVVSAAAESPLWTSMFKGNLYVEPHSFEAPTGTPQDYSPPVLSPPTKNLHDFIKQHYTSIARLSPAALPTTHQILGLPNTGVAENAPNNPYVDGLEPPSAGTGAHLASFTGSNSVRLAVGGGEGATGGLLRHVALTAPQVAQVKSNLLNELKTNKFIAHRPTLQPQLDFAQHTAFLQQNVAPKSALRTPVPPPEVDFHKAVSSLGDYPDLMRRLGLVIDLEVPLDTVPPGSGVVRVLPAWTGQPPIQDYTPSTAYTLTATQFAAAPTPGPNPPAMPIRAGMLDFSDANQYQVIEIDLDGAAAKTAYQAQQLQRRVTTAAAQAPARFEMLTKIAEMRPIAINGQPATPGIPPATQAADAGTDGLPSMRSAGLSVIKIERARHVVERYQFAFLHNVRLAAAVAPTAAAPPAELPYYAEDLVRGYRIDAWDSRTSQWHSLCQRQGSYTLPGTAMPWVHSDEGFVSLGVTKQPDDPTLYLHESLFRWTGWSLSAPRPGLAIDPTTQKPAPTDQKPSDNPLGVVVAFQAQPGTLPTLRFGTQYRFRARAVDLAGNGLTLDTAPKDFTGATAAGAYSRFDPVVSPTTILSKEITVPGETLEHMVIRSNFDTPAAAYDATSATSTRHLVPPQAAVLMAEERGALDSQGRPDPAMYDVVAKFEYLNADNTTHSMQGYVPVEPDGPLAMKYLPDPMATGAALRGLPGKPPLSPQQVPFMPAGGKWPGLAPFRLKVVEATTTPTPAPQWDDAQRVLTVSLAKADVVQVNLSSYLNEADLGLMGLSKWLNDTGGFAPTLQQEAIRGGFWMQTPYRTLTLIHAVQQPLAAPEFKKITPARDLGASQAALTFDVNFSPKSTAKLDVMSKWQEPLDDLTQPKPGTISGQAHVSEILIDPIYGPDQPVTEEHSYVRVQQFRDTKYRHVSYSAIAATRFLENFPDAIQQDLTKTTRSTAADMEVDVPNSARPAAPKVLYIVPTFRWDRNGTKSTRTGGGLRIYLERPWYSSGDGELLGVVLMSTAQPFLFNQRILPVAPPQPKVSFFQTPLKTRLSAAPKPVLKSSPVSIQKPSVVNAFSHGVIGLLPTPTQIPKELQPFVTQWGRDPLWNTTAPGDTMPALADFKAATHTQDYLTLDERPEHMVAVAGHPVQYDADRQLWYCDIELDANGSYMPFIRLALARYQPNSVDGAHLSRVVLTEFAQLAPDRSVSVAPDSSAPGRVTVSVTGTTYSGSAFQNAPSVVEVTLESRETALTGDYPWTPVPTAVAQAQPKGGTPMVWTASLDVPAGDGKKHRVVVREFEEYSNGRTLPPGPLERRPGAVLQTPIFNRGAAFDRTGALSDGQDDSGESDDNGARLAVYRSDSVNNVHEVRALRPLDTNAVRSTPLRPSTPAPAIKPGLEGAGGAIILRPQDLVDRRLVFVDAVELS